MDAKKLFHYSYISGLTGHSFDLEIYRDGKLFLKECEGVDCVSKKSCCLSGPEMHRLEDIVDVTGFLQFDDEYGSAEPFHYDGDYRTITYNDQGNVKTVTVHPNGNAPAGFGQLADELRHWLTLYQA